MTIEFINVRGVTRIHLNGNFIGDIWKDKKGIWVDIETVVSIDVIDQILTKMKELQANNDNRNIPK